jgi:hypothetical protein
MDEYKVFSQKAFESTQAFEKRLNEICQKGWKPISLSGSQMGIVALLEKVEKYNSY